MVCEKRYISIKRGSKWVVLKCLMLGTQMFNAQMCQVAYRYIRKKREREREREQRSYQEKERERERERAKVISGERERERAKVISRACTQS